VRLNVRHLRPSDLQGLRWRGYIRESSQEQTDRGTPVERQRRDIERAAEELHLVPAPPLWYERTGSGEAVGAPEIERAIEDARRGEYGVLAVFATSRLARNRAEAVRVKAALREAGVAIYFVTERIVSGAYVSSLAEGVGEVLDEHANEERRLFVAGGLREKQLSGRWVGSVPYGYRKHLSDNADGSRSWDGTLEPDPGEAPIVRRIFAECLSGNSPGDTALGLNAEGSNNRGALWRKSTIRRMISNPIFKGRLERYRSPSSLHYFPEADPKDGIQGLDVPWVIVSRAEWEAAQRVFPGRRPVPAHAGRRYPLSSVLRCGKGGGRMQGAYNGKGDRFYRCGTRAETGTCDGPTVKANEVEESFADWLDGFRLPEDWRLAIARLREPPKRSGSKEAKLRAYLERIKGLYAAGDMEWTEYAAARDATREKLAEQAPPDLEGVERVAAILAELGPLWREDPQPALPAALLDRGIVRDRRLVEFQPKASLRPLLEIACVAKVPRVRSRRCATPSPRTSMTATSSPSKVSRT
jgi:DNA invertase Pin-like site-specific DNA recombinase